MPVDSLSVRKIFKLQSLAIGVFLLLFVILLAVLYFQDCRREWRLGKEKADHRLELAFELISRELKRVRADVLSIASQNDICGFESGQPKKLRAVESNFSSLLNFKQTFQQLRLVDLHGHEAVRVEIIENETCVTPPHQLQDKSDRYYFRDSMQLASGDVFVSEFDLNQERGRIERPLKPVIRFVTPVVDAQGQVRFLLVANYRGKDLLRELANISLPLETFLIREDGQYLLGKQPDDAWGWQLGHANSFKTDFPQAWKQTIHDRGTHFIPGEGAFTCRPFAYRQRNLRSGSSGIAGANKASDKLFLVSRLSPGWVYATSNQLLKRLLIFLAFLLLPLFCFTRLWAVASLRRKQQNEVVQKSERRLRELSSRLVRIQEDERRAISREIHDQLGQQVTAINLDLKLLQQNSLQNFNGESGQLQRAIAASEYLLKTLQDFAARIRPVELDDLGLYDAVESHLEEFRQRTGVEFLLTYLVDEPELSDVVAENVFRLIQESLNNVLKHADATRVEVSIRTIELKTTKTLSVQILDNGIGFTKSSSCSRPGYGTVEGNSRLGILGMRERVELLGGSLELFSKSDQGAKIDVCLPLPAFSGTAVDYHSPVPEPGEPVLTGDCV